MDVDKLEAGRALDVLVAEHVFGWRVKLGPAYDYDGPCEAHLIPVPPTMSDKAFDDGWIWPARGVVQPWFFCEKWSTSIAAAWQVIDHIHLNQLLKKAVTLWASLKPDGTPYGWHCMFGMQVRAEAPTPELAICRAALKDVAGHALPAVSVR